MANNSAETIYGQMNAQGRSGFPQIPNTCSPPKERDLQGLSSSVLDKLRQAHGRLLEVRGWIQPSPPDCKPPEACGGPPSLHGTLDACEAEVLAINNIIQDIAAFVGEPK